MFIQSCKEETVDIDQNRIFTSYSVSFNSDVNKTSVTASFTLDKQSESSIDQLKLKHPACIKYAGKELLFNENTRSYEKEFLGEKEGTFEYSNTDGVKLYNSSSIPSYVEFLELADSVNLYQDFYIEWEGDTKSAGENIEILVYNIDSGKSFTVNDFTENTVYIDGSDLESNGPGTTIISITRSINQPANQKPDAGGKVIQSYVSQDTVYFY